MKPNKSHCLDCGRRITKKECEKFGNKCEECGSQETAAQKLEDMTTVDEMNFYSKRGEANPFCRSR